MLYPLSYEGRGPRAEGGTCRWSEGTSSASESKAMSDSSPPRARAVREQRFFERCVTRLPNALRGDPECVTDLRGVVGSSWRALASDRRDCALQREPGECLPVRLTPHTLELTEPT